MHKNLWFKYDLSFQVSKKSIWSLWYYIGISVIGELFAQIYVISEHVKRESKLTGVGTYNS